MLMKQSFYFVDDKIRKYAFVNQASAGWSLI